MKKSLTYLIFSLTSVLISLQITSCDFDLFNSKGHSSEEVTPEEESPPTSNALIVDHNAVQEFELIPEYWLNEAKKLAIHYGHTSHGSQIIAGLNYLEEYVDSEKYSVTVGPRNSGRTPDLPAEESPPALLIWEEGLWPDTADGHLGYWLGEEAINGTKNVLNSGLFDVSGWSWCGQVALNDWPYIQQYLDAMSYLEEQFPEVTFFYMTGHRVSDGPGDNYQRLMNNNEGITNYCIENNKILFDFADIESWDLDGNYHEEEDSTGVWCEDWLDEHPEEYPGLPPRSESGCGVICETCAHTHGLNCIIKAKAFWWMLARIAGWEGVQLYN